MQMRQRSILFYILVTLTLLSLILFVFLPTFYLISFTALNWRELHLEVFSNPLIGDEHWKQIKGMLLLSLRLAAASVLIDIVIGVPLAYLLARKNFKGKWIIEDIVLLPLVLPTSAFGFATLLTWTTASGIGGLLGLKRGIFEHSYVVPFLRIPLLILIVHVTLTFPYVVRILQSKLEELGVEYETVSKTIGASELTTFRFITFPQALPGLFSGSVLAFARSLGETGATMVVAGVTVTAPLAIVKWEQQLKLVPASFLGFLLILISTLIILPIEYLTSKGQSTSLAVTRALRFKGKLLNLERFISRKMYFLKDAAGLVFMFLSVLAPIVIVVLSVVSYWSADPFTGKVEGGILYQLFGPSNYFNSLLRATLTSFIAAGFSTYISTCIGIPTTLVIERFKWGKLLKSLLKIPLVVPTSALGLSMLMLWGPPGLGLLEPGVWLIILTHIVFSVPVAVESIASSYEGSRVRDYEEVARTLGASPYMALEAATIPSLKLGIFTGAILCFTHSLGETGATFMVMGRDLTVSTLVVNMVEALAIPAALFASTYLLVVSVLFLFLFRFLTGRGRGRGV